MLVFNFLFIFIKLSYSLVYVDVKNLIISQGVTVYHGYFGDNHMYLMFVGEEETIESVTFGDIKLYEIEPNSSRNYQIMVEFFEYRTNQVNVLILETDLQYNEELKILRFKIDKDRFYIIDCSHPCVKNAIVRLSVDINENKKKHPFIIVEKTDHADHTEIVFDTIKEYRGMYFDRRMNPSYKFGYVYDSSADVLVAYEFFKDLTNKCDKLTMKIRDGKYYAYMSYRNRGGEYALKDFKNKLYWTFVGPNLFLKGTGKSRSIVGKHRIERFRTIACGTNLDLSERVSPSYHDIEKVTGRFAIYEYIIYQSKERFGGVKNVVDTSLFDFRILCLKYYYKIVFVELFSTQTKKIVLINYKYDEKSIYLRHTEMFEYIDDVGIYRKLDEDEKNETQELIQSMWPIFLDVNIDDENNKIYENFNLRDDRFNFKYIWINQTDEYRNDYKNKYKIGKVLEINPYCVGNVPSEFFKRETRVIKDNINQDELLILNPFTVKPYNVSSYEIYVPTR